MLKAFLHRYTRGFERRYNYDATYMHEMADISPSGFIRFAAMQMTGGGNGGAMLPRSGRAGRHPHCGARQDSEEGKWP